MKLSDYAAELKFLKSGILEEGIAKTQGEAERLAKSWLENIEDTIS